MKPWYYIFAIMPTPGSKYYNSEPYYVRLDQRFSIPVLVKYAERGGARTGIENRWITPTKVIFYQSEQVL